MQSEFMRKLHLDPENKICADCGAPDPEYASLSHGSLICSRCCKQHRRLQGNVSHPVNISTHAWTSKDINMMLSGGNSLLKNFFIMYDFPHNCSIKYRYGSLAALYYREKLLSTVTGKEPSIPQPTIEESQKYMLPSTKRSIPEIVSGFFSNTFKSWSSKKQEPEKQLEKPEEGERKIWLYEEDVQPPQHRSYGAEMMHSISNFMKKIFYSDIKPVVTFKQSSHKHPKHANRHTRKHDRVPKEERQKWQEIDMPTSPLDMFEEERIIKVEYPENLKSPVKLQVQGFDLTYAKAKEKETRTDPVAMKEKGISGEGKMQNLSSQKGEQAFGDKHCEKRHHIHHHDEHVEKHDFLKRHDIPGYIKEHMPKKTHEKMGEKQASAADMNVMKDVGEHKMHTTKQTSKSHEKIAEPMQKQSKTDEKVSQEEKPKSSFTASEQQKEHIHTKSTDNKSKSPEKTSSTEQEKPEVTETNPLQKQKSHEEFVEMMKENISTVTDKIKEGAKTVANTFEEIFEQPGHPIKPIQPHPTPAAAKHEELESKPQPLSSESQPLSEEQVESMKKGVNIITQKLIDTFQVVKETVSEGSQELPNKSQLKEKAEGGKDEQKSGTIEKIRDLPFPGGRKEDLQELASQETMKQTFPVSKESAKQFHPKGMEELKPRIETKHKSPRISKSLEKVIKPGSKNADIFEISPSLLMPGSDGFTS
jgi:hypothetical protein